MRNPVVSVKSVERQLGLTNQGARNLIRSAAEIGWLTSLGAQGRGVREYWYAPKVLDILEAPMAYRADG